MKAQKLDTQLQIFRTVIPYKQDALRAFTPCLYVRNFLLDYGEWSWIGESKSNDKRFLSPSKKIAY